MAAVLSSCDHDRSGRRGVVLYGYEVSAPGKREAAPCVLELISGKFKTGDAAERRCMRIRDRRAELAWVCGTVQRGVRPGAFVCSRLKGASRVRDFFTGVSVPCVVEVWRECESGAHGSGIYELAAFFYKPVCDSAAGGHAVCRVCAAGKHRGGSGAVYVFFVLPCGEEFEKIYGMYGRKGWGPVVSGMKQGDRGSDRYKERRIEEGRMNNEERKKRLQIPTGRLRLVIDTDAKNEVDDQFAIAWALRSPERFQVEAVYAAPFSHGCFQNFRASKEAIEKSAELIGHAEDPGDGMRQSYGEIQRVFDLLHMDSENRIFYGSDRYIGKDGKPVPSAAAEDLIRRVKESEETLYIAALGAITNIASAVLMEPSVAEKIVLIWLAGQPLEFGHGIEFNLMQDVKASQIILDSKVPLVMIPCMNVASALTVSEQELRANLAGKNELGDYLYSIVAGAFCDEEAEKAFMQVDRGSYLLGREDYSEEYLQKFSTDHISWSRIIWDIAVIAFLKNPNWVLSRYESAPVLKEDLSYERGEDRPLIKVATYCWRNYIFGDLFYRLTQKYDEMMDR